MNNRNTNERQFDLNEIFFSRTDAKGKILSGNKVFQRVSGYEWGEMRHRAHNIIRHPDMPRGVFYLLWSFLEEKRPICAYVKNKAKDGKFYWVFAVVVPDVDGYLSVRIKPTSRLFRIVESAYSDLRGKELAENLSPKQSLDLLIGKIASLGYSSYEKFMTECFLLELESRTNQLGLVSSGEVSLLKEASVLGESLGKELARICKSDSESKFLPLNLEISSAYLIRDGAALAVVAASYRKLSEEVQAEILRFKDRAESLIGLLQESQFLMSARHLTTELVHFFERESDNDEIDLQEETKRLVQQSENYREKAKTSIVEVLQSLRMFKSACESVRSSVSGLEIMRLTGKIEAARLGDASEVINAIVGQLKDFQTLLLSILDKIEESRLGLEGCSERILVDSGSS